MAHRQEDPDLQRAMVEHAILSLNNFFTLVGVTEGKLHCIAADCIMVVTGCCSFLTASVTYLCLSF
jgi:hypothetical protein